MIITRAEYQYDLNDTSCNIKAIIDGQHLSVPLDPANRHYAEILRQLEAGTLTIQEAD